MPFLEPASQTSRCAGSSPGTAASGPSLTSDPNVFSFADGAKADMGHRPSCSKTSHLRTRGYFEIAPASSSSRFGMSDGEGTALVRLSPFASKSVISAAETGRLNRKP